MRPLILLLLGVSTISLVRANAQAPAAPSPAPTITLQSVTNDATGIQASVQLQHVDAVRAKIEILDQNSGTLNSYLDTGSLQLGSLRDTANPASGPISIPVLAPDSTQTYRLTLLAFAASDGDNIGLKRTAPETYTISSKSPVISDSVTFKGYSPPGLVAVSLTFNQSTLTVAAKTNAVMTLTAAWSVSGSGMGTLSDKEQNPHVDLNYSDLEPGNTSNAGATLPSIDVKLTDATGNTQESVISPAVSMSQSAKQTVQKAQQNPKKKTITWQDIAGGLANIVKFFAKP